MTVEIIRKSLNKTRALSIYIQLNLVQLLTENRLNFISFSNRIQNLIAHNLQHSNDFNILYSQFWMFVVWNERWKKNKIWELEDQVLEVRQGDWCESNCDYKIDNLTGHRSWKKHQKINSLFILFQISYKE